MVLLWMAAEFASEASPVVIEILHALVLAALAHAAYPAIAPELVARAALQARASS